jgi:hypothetical protein
MKSNVVKLEDIQMYIDKCKNKSIRIYCNQKNPSIVESIYWTSVHKKFNRYGNYWMHGIEQHESIHVSGWNYNTEETINTIKQIKK